MRSATSNTSFMLCVMMHDAEALLGEPPDEVEHLRGLGDAERGGGLVEQHDLGVPEHGLGDRDGLALAAGEARDASGGRSCTVRTESVASVLRAEHLHRAARRARAGAALSRPRNMFWTMSRLSQSARSW